MNAAATPKARRTYGTGSIYQRASDGRWMGAIRYPDGTRRYVSGKTQREVQKQMKPLLWALRHPAEAAIQAAIRAKQEKAAARAAVARAAKARYRYDRTIQPDVIRAVLRRDGRVCGYCGATLIGLRMHIDHITPVSKGGTNTADNLIVSCAPCNLRKAARTPDQAGMGFFIDPDDCA